MKIENPVDVVIIEDSEYDCELTEFALLQANDKIRFRHFTDGMDALNFIFGKKKYKGNETQSDLKFVLLDLSLPTISGLDLLRRIRGEAETKKLPVIIVSGSEDERDIKTAYELGVNSYVIKPSNFGGYVDKIKALGFYWSCLNERLS